MHEYLLLSEIAEITRVSLSTVRHWVRQGRLASVKPGRRRLVHRDALNRMLNRGAKPNRNMDPVPPKGTALSRGDGPDVTYG